MLPFRFGSCIYRRFGICLNHTGSFKIPHLTESVSRCDSYDFNEMPERRLKVAILGAPNAGKSTLINKIVGHPVMCVSKKVHTTRSRERAAINRENVQILFVDTPGLVSQSKIKKHNLDSSFKNDGLKAVREANIVGVIHDAANTWTRGHLDNNILHILHAMGSKRSFLVLNKVDAVKSKGKLLNIVQQLTKPESHALQATTDVEGPNLELADCNKEEQSTKRPRYYNNFSEVFLVSALKGDGVSDVLDYLLKEAEEGSWFLPPGQITDQTMPQLLQELVRGRLLDALPQEVPYNLTIETEYLHVNDLGEVIAVVLVTCPLLRYQKMLVAGSGRIVRDVATLAEADARDALRTNVRLRVVVTSREDRKQTPREKTM